MALSAEPRRVERLRESSTRGARSPEEEREAKVGLGRCSLADLDEEVSSPSACERPFISNVILRSFFNAPKTAV